MTFITAYSAVASVTQELLKWESNVCNPPNNNYLKNTAPSQHFTYTVTIPAFKYGSVTFNTDSTGQNNLTRFQLLTVLPGILQQAHR